MTLPKVTINEIDGALGISPATSGRLVAFVGPASAGSVDLPSTFARVSDLVAAYGGGNTVEAAAYYITTTGRPCVFVKTGASGVAAAVSAVTKVGSGTSVGTIAASPTPYDDFQYRVLIVTGGTIGVAGCTYQLSQDDGRTYAPVSALGTAVAITLSTGVTLSLAAGTLVAGDTYAATATAAKWSAAELGTALTALGNSTIQWEQVAVVGALDANAFDQLELNVIGWSAIGRERNWFAAARVPNAGESEATYLSALSAIFSAKSTTHGAVCAGACKLTSGVSGAKYRRSILASVVAAHGGASEEIDCADINRGSLPGVSIRDVNGNVDEHDELINPGLDDARFIALRTWEGYPGVYINRPILMSAPGSDFELVPHRRVMNLARIALRSYFTRRLNRPIRVNESTGYILETEALQMEAGGKAVLRAALMATPKASGFQLTLSRTDNVLSTKTLTVTVRIIPLGYPEFITITLGFYNPALALQAA